MVGKAKEIVGSFRVDTVGKAQRGHASVLFRDISSGGPTYAKFFAVEPGDP